MKSLFDYDYSLNAGDHFYLEDIINQETYQRLFSQKFISFLNKGQCGNGGTTGFVQYALNNAKGCLILVPNRSIVISKEEDRKVRNRMAAFEHETQTRAAILPTWITPYGLYKNEYSSNVHFQVSIDDLFSPD